MVINVQTLHSVVVVEMSVWQYLGSCYLHSDFSVEVPDATIPCFGITFIQPSQNLKLLEC